MNETSLNLAGIELPLMQSPRGPLLSINHPEIEPLSWLINLSVDGGLQGLQEQIESERNIHYKGIHATLEDSGNYRLWSDFCTTSITLPPQSILELLSHLRVLRESFQPRSSGKAARKEVELTSPVADQTFDSTVQPRTLRPLEELESRAVELDRLVQRERSLENASEESAKRRFLLLDLAASGIFELDAEIPGTLPTLKSYHSTALKVARYLSSEPRRRFNPDATSAPIIGGPVSIDWFRFPSPVPSHLTEDEWLAFLENILVNGGAHGGEGEIFVPVGVDWWTLHWRCDDAVHPAIVAARISG